MSQPNPSTSAPLGTSGLAGRLPASGSILLDMLRITAALAVVFDHASLQDFHLGIRDHQLWGFIAVPVFFILSGFIIRHVTLTREANLRTYLIDRASRIYSVVLPALVFSFLLGQLCYLLDPHAFLHGWAGTFSQPVQRLVLNLLFLSQAWGLDTTPFLDLPFWSLGYECSYYILFGCFFYLRGRSRFVSVACILLVIGPEVLLLLPTWALGCVVYDLFIRLRHSRRICGLAAFSLLSICAVIAAFPAPMHIVQSLERLPNPLALASLPVKHATMLALGAGLLSAPTLLLLLLAAELLRMEPRPWHVALRRIADGTFALYLFHYPLLVVALFLGLLTPQDHVLTWIAITGICLLCVAVSPALDRLKRLLRSVLQSISVTPAPPTSLWS